MTVSVTVFAPTFAHVNEFGATVMEAIPQASEDPLLICAAVIEAFPDASSCTVMFWHVATGATWSSTVTVEEQVEEFPFESVTVSVTVFAPTFAHVNEFGVTVIEATPHASDQTLCICAVVIEAFPLASSCTVMFWQVATGAT